MNEGKVVKNASWIIGVQIAKALLGIVISMLTARYLGPTNYGLLNYAASIITFLTPVMYLGLKNTLVQELVAAPNKEGEILGTAITMSFCSSILCILGAAVFVSLANRGEHETLVVCLLYSLLLIFQSVELIVYWFQAKLLSKSSSLVSLCAYILVSGYKIFLLATGKNIYWFALSNALDYCIIAFALLYIYRSKRGQKLHFSMHRAKELFKHSKYYIISGLMIVIYAQTDRIMLKLMVGNVETGYYSAAVYCAGMASFVFSAIIDSMRPVIFRYKVNGDNAYETSIIWLYSIIIYLAAGYSIVMSVFAPYVINVLYGQEYLAAVPILQIVVWYCTASYIGGAFSVWVLAEGKQRCLILINAVGAGLNVILNAILIPKWHAVGAAAASVTTQYAINIIFVSLYRPTRRNGYLMLQGCSPKVIVSIIKHLKKGANHD